VFLCDFGTYILGVGYVFIPLEEVTIVRSISVFV
jgi:hypothetical protein